MFTSQDVVILNVNPGSVTHHYTQSLLSLANHSHYVHPHITEPSHVNINHSRNTCVQRFIESHYPLSLWLDSDTVFEPDLIDRLLKSFNKGKRVVGGVCWIVNKQQPVLWDMNNHIWWDYPPGLIQASLTSLACLMVHKDVYTNIALRSKTPFPWFRETVDPNTKKWVGEDVYFCRKVREASHKIYVDADIRLGHQKEFALYYPPERNEVQKHA